MEFKSIDQFNQFMENNSIKEIDSGCEGTCYLGKDGYVYKTFLTGFEIINYNINAIITTKDIPLEYILFPIEIYTLNNRLIGLKTRYIENNQFTLERDNNYLLNLDFDKLKEAYEEILIDVIILAMNSIKIYDLPYNLLFDGNRFYAIDTCGYKFSAEDKHELMKHNIESLNIAIMDAINSIINKEDECYTNSYKKYIKTLEKKQKKYSK